MLSVVETKVDRHKSVSLTRRIVHTDDEVECLADSLGPPLLLINVTTLIIFLLHIVYMHYVHGIRHVIDDEHRLLPPLSSNTSAPDTLTSALISSARHIKLSVSPALIARFNGAEHLIITVSAAAASSSDCSAVEFDFIFVNGDAVHLVDGAGRYQYIIPALTAGVAYRIGLVSVRSADLSAYNLRYNITGMNQWVVAPGYDAWRLPISRRSVDCSKNSVFDRAVLYDFGVATAFDSAADEYAHEVHIVSDYLDTVYRQHILPPVSSSTSIPPRKKLTWERAHDYTAMSAINESSVDWPSQTCSAKFWEWYNDYAQWHHQMISYTSPLYGVTDHDIAAAAIKQHNIKYAVEDMCCDTGLADRMISFITTLAEAILARRVLLVVESFAFELDSATTTSLVLSPPLAAPVIYNSSHHGDLREEMILEYNLMPRATSYRRFTDGHRVYRMRSNRGALNRLLTESSTSKRLAGIGLTINNMYGCLHAALFVPKVRTLSFPGYEWPLVSALTPTIHQIGLQIRAHTLDRQIYNDDHTLVEVITAEQSAQDVMQIYQRILECTMSVAMSSLHRHSFVAIFLITDTDMVASAFRTIYGGGQKSSVIQQNSQTVLQADYHAHHHGDVGVYLAQQCNDSVSRVDWISLVKPEVNVQRLGVTLTCGGETGHIGMHVYTTSEYARIIRAFTHSWAEQTLYAQSADMIYDRGSGFGRLAVFFALRDPQRLISARPEDKFVCQTGEMSDEIGHYTSI